MKKAVVPSVETSTQTLKNSLFVSLLKAFFPSRLSVIAMMTLFLVALVDWGGFVKPKPINCQAAIRVSEGYVIVEPTVGNPIKTIVSNDMIVNQDGVMSLSPVCYHGFIGFTLVIIIILFIVFSVINLIKMARKAKQMTNHDADMSDSNNTFSSENVESNFVAPIEASDVAPKQSVSICNAVHEKILSKMTMAIRVALGIVLMVACFGLYERWEDYSALQHDGFAFWMQHENKDIDCYSAEELERQYKQYEFARASWMEKLPKNLATFAILAIGTLIAGAITFKNPIIALFLGFVMAVIACFVCSTLPSSLEFFPTFLYIFPVYLSMFYLIYKFHVVYLDKALRPLSVKRTSLSDLEKYRSDLIQIVQCYKMRCNDVISLTMIPISVYGILCFIAAISSGWDQNDNFFLILSISFAFLFCLSLKFPKSVAVLAFLVCACIAFVLATFCDILYCHVVFIMLLPCYLAQQSWSVNQLQSDLEKIRNNSEVSDF